MQERLNFDKGLLSFAAFLLCLLLFNGLKMEVGGGNGLLS